MSNPFLNKILYGVGNSQVNAEFMEGLKPYMYTSEWKSAPKEEGVASEVVEEPHPHTMDGKECPDTMMENQPNRMTPSQKNTLFWSVFMSVYEYPEYMEASRRSGNREIEEKLRMVECLKKTPKILKESSAKLTLEQTQALYGSLLTTREDRLEFCAAYAAFYKRPIVIVYSKTYRVFSPTAELGDEPPIILWASPGPKHSVVYSLDHESNIKELIAERTSELKAQSNYKIGELVQLATRLNLVLPPKPKKQEVYDAIRVAIHKDMSFVM